MGAMRCWRIALIVVSIGISWLPSTEGSESDMLRRVNDTWAQDSKLLGHPISRVYGGKKIVSGTYPYAYASLLLGGSQHQCGATFVAADVLLTAAHCFEWFDTVRIAEYNMVGTARSANDHPYAEVIQHSAFDESTFQNDIMVIRLKNPVPDATFVRMNQINEIPYDYQTLTVVGWGAIVGQTAFPGYLHYAHVPYITNGDCENTVYKGKQLYKGQITPDMLCAGGDGVDACRGDSGSPLVLPSGNGDMLVGLVSWGRGCAIYPGVYTRMSHFYDWSREQVCYLSSDPPTYLNCKDEERGPYRLSTPSPSFIFPSVAPTTKKPSASTTEVDSIVGLSSSHNQTGVDSTTYSPRPVMKERELASGSDNYGTVRPVIRWVLVGVALWNVL